MARCGTPRQHPPVESWDPGRGIHTTTTRDCCHTDPFPPDGVYPANLGPIDHDDPH